MRLQKLIAAGAAVILGAVLAVAPGGSDQARADVQIPGVGSIVIDAMANLWTATGTSAEYVGMREFFTGMQNGKIWMNKEGFVSLSDVYAGKYGDLKTLYSHCTSQKLMLATWQSRTGLPCPGISRMAGS